MPHLMGEYWLRRPWAEFYSLPASRGMNYALPENPKDGRLFSRYIKRFVPRCCPRLGFAFDIEGAGFDQAYWNDGSGNFEKMLARLRQLDHKNKSMPNQVRDILIAETAIKNGATLVSGNSNLRQVVTEFGGNAIEPDDL
jgi:hypothetical protein